MSIKAIALHAIRGWWILAAWGVAVLLVRAYLDHHRFQPGDPRDARLLFGAAVVISVSVIYMVVQTRHWTVQAVSVLGLITFDAALYGLTTSNAIFGWHEPTDSDLNLLRAILIVSGPLLALSHIWNIGTGIARWWRGRKHS